MNELIKRICLAFSIIIIVIIFDFIISNNTKNVVDSMNSELSKIYENLEDGKETKNEIEELNKNWEKREKIMSCYLDHDEIEKISSKINLINTQTLDTDSVINELIFLFNHLKSKQSLNIENFF